MANIITGSRIIISVVLLFFPALSPTFFVLYITAAITDMTDGAVARETDTVSEFGSKLDTLADIVFVAICLIKMLPVMHIPVWLCIWIVAIALIKVSNIAAGYIRQKKICICAFHNKKGNRRAAVHFSVDAVIHRYQIQCRSCMHCCDNSSGS